MEVCVCVREDAMETDVGSGSREGSCLIERWREADPQVKTGEGKEDIGGGRTTRQAVSV